MANVKKLRNAYLECTIRWKYLSYWLRKYISKPSFSKMLIVWRGFKAYKLLGHLRRICLKHFKAYSARVVYVAIVRPHVEYASVVWSPYHITKIESIEKVQKRFIKMLCFSCFNIVYHRKDYINHCKNTSVEALDNKC